MSSPADMTAMKAHLVASFQKFAQTYYEKNDVRPYVERWLESHRINISRAPVEHGSRKPTAAKRANVYGVIRNRSAALGPQNNRVCGHREKKNRSARIWKQNKKANIRRETGKCDEERRHRSNKDNKHLKNERCNKEGDLSINDNNTIQDIKSCEVEGEYLVNEVNAYRKTGNCDAEGGHPNKEGNEHSVNVKTYVGTLLKSNSANKQAHVNPHKDSWLETYKSRNKTSNFNTDKKELPKIQTKSETYNNLTKALKDRRRITPFQGKVPLSYFTKGYAIYSNANPLHVMTSDGSQKNSRQSNTRTTLPPAKQNGGLVTSGEPYDHKPNTSKAGNSQPKDNREITKHAIPPQVRRDGDTSRNAGSFPGTPRNYLPKIAPRSKGRACAKISPDEPPRLTKSASALQNPENGDKPGVAIIPPLDLSELSNTKQKTKNKHHNRKENKTPAKKSQTNKENKKPNVSVVQEDSKGGKKFVASYTRSKPDTKSSSKNDKVSSKEEETNTSKKSNFHASGEQKESDDPEISAKKKDSRKEAATGSDSKKNGGKRPESDKSQQPEVNEKTTKPSKSDYAKDRRDISPLSKGTDDTTVSKEGSHQQSLSLPSKRKNVGSKSGSESGSSYRPKPKTKRSKVFGSKSSKPMYSRDKKIAEINNMTPRKENTTISVRNNKSRPHSYHLDTERSIYRSSTQLFNADKDELTYHPSTNTDTDVMLVYTGEYNMREAREALKSARGKKHRDEEDMGAFQTRSKIPPWYEKEYVLNRRQASMYHNVKSTYGASIGSNKTREKHFLKKLQAYQKDMAEEELYEMRQKERKKHDDKRRQALQLKELRQRFEDEAWHRFHTQYVTSRVLEHEKMNRFEYGLPEDPTGKPEYGAKLKRRKKKLPIDMTKQELNKLNRKNYSHMFKKNVGPAWSKDDKDPKMEGIDTVILNVEDKEGNKKEKTKNVVDVIKDAKRQSKKVPENGTKSGDPANEPKLPTRDEGRRTPAFDLDSDDDDDDDDMSDIFERAKRKYNLDVDIDSVSRNR